MSRMREFHAQIAAIKKATPPAPAQAEKAAPKTQGNGDS